MTDRIRAFERHIACRTAVGTRAAYAAAIRKFNKFLEMEAIPLDSLPSNTLERYAAHILAEQPHLSPSSVQVYVKGVKQYLLFVRKEGILIPAFKITADRRARDVAPPVRPRALTPADLDVFALWSAKQPDPFRTIFLLQTIVPVPLTPLCALEAAALKIVQRAGTIPTTWLDVEFRGRARRVPIVPVALPVLARYLRVVRPAIGSSSWLFPSPWADHRHIPERTVIDHYHGFFRETRVSVTPTVLYRSALAQLAAAGLDAAMLSRMTGRPAPSLAMDLPQDAVHPSWDAVFHAAARAKAPWLKGLS